MEWAVHVTCTGRREIYAGFWREKKLKGRYWEDLGVDGRILNGF